MSHGSNHWRNSRVKVGAMSRDTCAIVVAYQPGLARLVELLSACRPQVSGLVVVDNGSDAAAALAAACRDLDCAVLRLDENLGVAAAQNAGVAWAREHGYRRFVLFDQDSIPAPDMVRQLSEALDTLQGQGHAVGAVGPCQVDDRDGRASPFVRFLPFRVARSHCRGPDQAPVAADFLISSGLLFTAEAYAAIGPFDDALFIDNVDLDWCFRGRAAGHGFFGVCAARLRHRIGDQVLRLGGLGTIHRHSPLRQYYIMRNRIALYRRPHAPAAWILQDVPRLLFKFAVFALFLPPRRANLAMMLRGMRDGLRGRLGRLKES
jgi:rhamnosyltransferase